MAGPHRPRLRILSAIGDPTALLGGASGNGGAAGFLGNGRRGRPGGGAFADSDEGIATGGAGSSAVIAGPGGNADTSINRGTGLAADGKGGRGSDGGFFSPGGNGGNADTSINRGTGLAADGKGGRGSDGGLLSRRQRRPDTWTAQRGTSPVTGTINAPARAAPAAAAVPPTMLATPERAAATPKRPSDV